MTGYLDDPKGLLHLKKDTVKALAGTSGTPSDSNRFVTQQDASNNNDRTASGLRTASGIVNIAGSAAPTPGQALVATSPTSASWQNVSAGGGAAGFGVYAHARTEANGASVYAIGMSVTRISTGLYEYTFTDALPDTEYSVLVTPNLSLSNDSNAFVHNISPTGFRIAMASGDNGTAADTITDIPHSVGVLTKGGGPSPFTDVYDIWLLNGNTGSVTDFLNSLIGQDGSAGADGRSAYQVWLDLGNTGTEADFIASLTGPQGIPGTSSSIIGDRFRSYDSSLVITTTTPTLYDTWVTPVLEGGQYVIRWTWTMSTQTYSVPGRYRINVDSTNADTNIILDYTMASAYNSTERLGALGVATVNLTPGAHTFRSFLNRVGTTSRVVGIYHSFIELIRVES